MTQEACAGGKCAPCRTLAGVRVNALTSDSIIHRHDRQFAQRLLRMTTKKAVAQAQYPRPGRVRELEELLADISETERQDALEFYNNYIRFLIES